MKTPPPPEWDGVEHLKSKSFGCPKMEDPLWRKVDRLNQGQVAAKDWYAWFGEQTGHYW